MKKVIVFTVIFFSIILKTNAQEATLIDSKSILVPRYANLGVINQILNPVSGMLVYSNGNSVFFYYNGFSWVNLATGGTNAVLWDQSGNDIYNSLSGNVGIGALVPSAYGHGGTNKFLEIRNSNTTANSQSHLVLSSSGSSGSAGTITWAKSNGLGVGDPRLSLITTELLPVVPGQLNPRASLNFYTNNGTFLGKRLTINDDGSIGLGIPNPTSYFHIGNTNGNSMRIEGPSTALSNGKTLSMGGYGELSMDKPGIVGGRFVIKENGNVGIDIAAPSEKLEVNGKIKTSNLQVTTGAALNSVLTSDALGNASWSSSPQPWTVTISSINYPSGNVGVNEALPRSSLEVNGTFATKVKNIASGSVVLDASATIWYFSAGSPYSFPPANSCPNRRYILVNPNNVPNQFSIGSYIDLTGTANTNIPANASIEVVSDGSNWLQIR